MYKTEDMPKNVNANSESPLPKCPTDPNTHAPFTWRPIPNNMDAGTK